MAKKIIIPVFIFIFLLSKVVLADSSGPNNGSSFASDSSVGTISWTSPSNAQSDDGSYASASFSSGASSYYLKATGFNFSIPSGATVNGILVEIKKATSGLNTSTDNSVKIVKDSSVAGSNYASGSSWPTTAAYSSYGGASDLWGLTLTSSDINSSGFGVAISATGTGGGTSLVDAIRITVYYTTSSGVEGAGVGSNTNIPSPSDNITVTKFGESIDSYVVVKAVKTGEINLYIPQESKVSNTTLNLRNSLFIKKDSYYIPLINANVSELSWDEVLYIKDGEDYMSITKLFLKNSKGEYSSSDETLSFDNIDRLIFATLVGSGSDFAVNGLTYNNNKVKSINPFEIFNKYGLPHEWLTEEGLPIDSKTTDLYKNTAENIGKVFEIYKFRNPERAEKWTISKKTEVINPPVGENVVTAPIVEEKEVVEAKDLVEKINNIPEVITRFAVRFSENILGNSKTVVKRSTLFASLNSEKGGNEVFQIGQDSNKKAVVVGRISPKALSAKNKKYSDVRYYTDGLNTVFSFKNTDGKIVGLFLSQDQISKIISNPVKSSREAVISLVFDSLNAKKDFPLQDKDLLDRVSAIDRANSSGSTINYKLIGRRFNIGKINPVNPEISILSSLSFNASGNPIIKNRPCLSKIDLANLKKISC